LRPQEFAFRAFREADADQTGKLKLSDIPAYLLNLVPALRDREVGTQ